MESWLVNGITATFSGMFTVFLVLILIAFVISKFKYLNSNNKIKTEKTESDDFTERMEFKNEDEEVAAIIGAIVSMLEKESKDKLIVRRIKRID